MIRWCAVSGAKGSKSAVPVAAGRKYKQKKQLCRVNGGGRDRRRRGGEGEGEGEGVQRWAIEVRGTRKELFEEAPGFTLGTLAAVQSPMGESRERLARPSPAPPAPARTGGRPASSDWTEIGGQPA